MDFSKAFDSVKHILLSEKFKNVLYYKLVPKFLKEQKTKGCLQ